jgi:hypothetical protein
MAHATLLDQAFQLPDHQRTTMAHLLLAAVPVELGNASQENYFYDAACNDMELSPFAPVSNLPIRPVVALGTAVAGLDQMSLTSRGLDTPSPAHRADRRASRRSSSGGDVITDTPVTAEVDLAGRDQETRRTFSRSFSADVADLGSFLEAGQGYMW